jgi:hypothetical protein
MTGPYLSELFKRAFIDGLHDPKKRPMAAEWENAILKTIDMLQPCATPTCEMKWYVVDSTRKCPFCQAKPGGEMPLLNLYVPASGGKYLDEKRRIMIWDGQSLFPHHVNKNIVANEKLDPSNAKRVGYFQRINGSWFFINVALDQLKDTGSGTVHGPGSKVEMKNGLTLLLSGDPGARVAQVQFVP